MEKTVNRVEIVGHVGTDPRVTTFEDGRQVVRLSVATDENFRDRNGEWRQEAIWHTIVAWGGKDMPNFSDIRKGQRLSVNGKIRNKSFEGRDGQTKYVYEILAHSLKIDANGESE